MKLTKAFVYTMNNFAKINQNMYFRQGTVQSTALFPAPNSNSLTLFARAQTDVEIEQSFGVINLKNFLNAISIFENFEELEISIDKKFIHFKDSKKMIDYELSNPTFLKFEENPDRLKLGETNIKFQMTDDDLSNLSNLYSLFGLEHISFIGENGTVRVEASNQGVGSKGSITLGETEENFRAVLKTRSLLIKESMSYNISVVRKGYVHFQNNIFEYFIPCEKGLSQL